MTFGDFVIVLLALWGIPALGVIAVIILALNAHKFKD